MQLANQASQLSLSLAANLALAHFWLQQNKMAMAEIQTWGFKMAVHKPVGDVMNATSIIYTVFSQN